MTTTCRALFSGRVSLRGSFGSSGTCSAVTVSVSVPGCSIWATKVTSRGPLVPSWAISSTSGSRFLPSGRSG